jgi:hypothetical protein
MTLVSTEGASRFEARWVAGRSTTRCCPVAAAGTRRTTGRSAGQIGIRHRDHRGIVQGWTTRLTAAQVWRNHAAQAIGGRGALPYVVHIGHRSILLERPRPSFAGASSSPSIHTDTDGSELPYGKSWKIAKKVSGLVAWWGRIARFGFTPGA